MKGKKTIKKIALKTWDVFVTGVKNGATNMYAQKKSYNIKTKL